ncbi:DNA-binding protein [Streptomyces sp. NPDC046915]|uniref:DNA-binding protein n=1 Tax=Streptomyces sp. NPDC046915 TaxID=3155257 RepID=UPI0033C7C384
MTPLPVLLRTAPVSRETTWSLMGRVAATYGMHPEQMLGHFTVTGSRPRHEGGAVRADAELLLNEAGRRMLAGLSGVGQDMLGRALPALSRKDAKAGTDEGAARAVWRVGGAAVGPVAYGCRLCTARRCGAGARVVRYAQRWERVCGRHARWQLDADADQPLEHLDLRGLPEVVAAQRRWAKVTRHAARAGVEAERVFGLAHAVVARWWDQALRWEQEKVWPRRLHQIAGGNAGDDLERWRIVGRDTVVFPEVIAVTEALLDPVMAELAWIDSGEQHPRPLPADGVFCRRLGERVGRPWLGPLAATDYGGPLINWMGSIIRTRRSTGRPSEQTEDPWRVRQELQPATMAAQLRVLGKEKKAPGSGTMWRTVVPAEQRALISSLIDAAEEQLIQLRGAQTGPTVDVARRLLLNLSHGADLIDQALWQSASAALSAGMALEDLAQWARLPADALAEALAAYQDSDHE